MADFQIFNEWINYGTRIDGHDEAVTFYANRRYASLSEPGVIPTSLSSCIITSRRSELSGYQ
ncbi:hypothetical protein J6590_028316 [Homalodisca vitripennis]|nr:hypothetical protein J6590_028316 [Homalodisca vitripennis]